MKTVLVGIAISLAVLVATGLALIAFDLHLHNKFDKLAGLNYKGYRGQVLGRKVPGEVRIGLFGGSVAMGYGVTNEVSIAAFLERALNGPEATAGRGTRYTVANLATNGESDLAFFKFFFSSSKIFKFLPLAFQVFLLSAQIKHLLPGLFNSSINFSLALRNHSFVAAVCSSNISDAAGVY